MVPRAGLLIWKLLHRVVPLGKIIHDRIEKGDPICAMCGPEEEDVSHLSFACPFTRS